MIWPNFTHANISNYKNLLNILQKMQLFVQILQKDKNNGKNSCS